MKSHRLFLFLALAALPYFGMSQASQTVKVSARGTDVRTVVHDLFTQGKKNYILDPNVELQLYLSLNDVEFDEAFELICKTAGLTYEVQNGIYFIKADPKGPSHVKPAPAKTEPKAETKPLPKPDTKTDPKPEVKTQPKAPIKEATAKPRDPGDPLSTVPSVGGKPVVVPAKTAAAPTVPHQTLDQSILSKRVTTRLQKVDLRDLAAELSKQVGVQIEVDPSVPSYRLDAYLLKTSLKYALDRIAKAAGLNYIFTDRNSILLQNGTASKRS